MMSVFQYNVFQTTAVYGFNYNASPYINRIF